MSENSIRWFSFLFLSFYVLKTVLIGLVFQSDASLGTFVTFATTSVFLFMLLLARIHSMRVKQQATIALGSVIAYIAWSGASVFWSYADSRYVAAFYWLSGVLDIAVVWLLFELGKRKVVFESGLKGVIFSGCLLVLIMNLLLDVQNDGRLGSELVHINTLGSQLAVACICSLYFFSQSQTKFWFVIFAFLSSGLVSTLSKTSIASFGVALVLYFLLAKSARGAAFFLFAILLSVLWWFSSDIFVYIDNYSQSSGNDLQAATETLSGRTILWAETWYMISDAWFTGYGFFSFRDVGPDVFSIHVPHAHNEFLQQWFSLGLIGLVLTYLIYMRVAWHWWQCRKQQVGFESNAALVGLALLGYSIMRGMTEASVAWLVFPMPLMFVFLLVQSK